ncbi:MAG TPA: hypothetical protein VGS07_24980 [Thermoanaerobaculia bacterium]|jgi:hypothetical protein|nr:hypothetical protein [Thermoanaerobaculia bacterium]
MKPILRSLASSLLVLLGIAGLVEAETALQTRSPRGRELVSTEFPCATFRVPAVFEYVGSHSFRIDGVSEGERHIFVQARHHRISRLVILQFEAILPASTEIYRYPLNTELWGLRWRENFFAFSNRQAVHEKPADEAALTVAFLRSKGYRFDDEWMVWRMATVPDPAKRHEAILFYCESVRASGHRLQDYVHGEENTDLWRRLSPELRQRALSDGLEVVARCAR